MKYKYVFGPVPSRRLGMSLGVDIMPHKTCTLDCIYCECGKTTNLTLDRKDYISETLICEELNKILKSKPELDYITFSGSGEPTLNKCIGNIINFLKYEYPEYKIALLTNGTQLYQDKVRQSILTVDLVVASLDAATEAVFNAINRPHSELKLSKVIDGLISFRKEFKNDFWVEFFVIPDINDNDSELSEIRQLISRIKPDKIQLNTIDRPGTEHWVKPADKKVLAFISSSLYNAEIIDLFDSKYNNKIIAGNNNKQILTTIKRRPCTAEDVSQILGFDLEKVQNHLDSLVERGEIKKKKMQRGLFYIAIKS
ncbi:MAG: radical SAM protein [Desulfobacterales bacterium]|jgi:wyosine [tRNA(Phe)-imidazoG37] synthetase (radical SAM superfamily)|nr:radical SAM protein [Desulfobacteraceae bacterium]MBT4364394.1 radical SAM protein [Desulfobacteraceae bacterium]MBT7085710.1 radical SAM protein [Desulfobacterales bacterium]MBT7696245.1 radical SAM protein [Desulfobacterales bacterium]